MNIHSCETREELVMNFAFDLRRPAGLIGWALGCVRLSSLLHTWCIYGERMVHEWCMLTLDTQPLPVAVPLVDKSTPQADHLHEPTRSGEGTRDKGRTAGRTSSCEPQAKCTRAPPRQNDKTLESKPGGPARVTRVDRVEDHTCREGGRVVSG